MDLSLDKLRRGLLQKIHNTAQTFKQNTLDKTNLDERLVSGVQSATRNFTQPRQNVTSQNYKPMFQSRLQNVKPVDYGQTAQKVQSSFMQNYNNPQMMRTDLLKPVRPQIVEFGQSMLNAIPDTNKIFEARNNNPLLKGLMPDNPLSRLSTDMLLETPRSAGRLLAGSDRQLDQRSVWDRLDAIGLMPMGSVATKGISSLAKHADYLKQVADPQTINQIMDFVIDVQKSGGKKNYGEAGQTIHAIAVDVFGEKARNLSNAQLANLFDSTIKEIGKKRNVFGLGLATDDLRGGKVASKQFNLASKLDDAEYKVFNDAWKREQRSLMIDDDLMEDLPRNITGKQAFERMNSTGIMGEHDAIADDVVENLRKLGYTDSAPKPVNLSSEGTKMRSGKIKVRNFPTQTEVKNRAELNAGNPDLYTQRGQKLDEMFGSSDEAFTGLKDNVAQQGAAEARVAMTGGGVNNFDRELKNSFQNWVNTRSASRVEGFLKKKEYKDLDSLGMDAIFDFQSSSNKTPRFKELNSYLDSKRQEVIKKTGTDFGYKQNYLPQLWDNTEEEIQQALGNRLSQKSTFMLSSVIKDYKEGIAKGLTPRYKTISELAGWYEQHANKLIADADFFQYLGKEGFISSSGKAPQHWVTLDPDRFPKINVSVDGTKYTGAYKAPPDLAEAINNYLRDPQFKMLNTVADYVSRVKNVALNFGIPGTGINMHGVNMLARHTLMGTGGNPVSRMIKAGTFMVNPKAAERELDTLMKRAPKAVKDGLTVSAEGYSGIGDQAENIAGQFSKKWEDLFGTPLFNKMIPALKISSYEKLVKDGMNGKDAAKLVNNVYGGINWEQMGRNRDFQNLLRSIILAPDWGETTVRLGGNFVKALNPMHKSATANRYRTMMATIIASYVAHNVVNKISSGHYSYENDPGHTFEIEAGYTADGQKRYLRPYGTALDMVRLPYDIAKGLTQGDISGLARTVRNRLSIPLGVVVGGLTDTDYRGNTIGYRGTDRFGNEMPASQRAVNIGSEVASFVGFPSFAKQFGLSATGQQGLEQGLLQGFELPFRYSNTGNSNVQEQLNFIAQDQGLEGKELYDFNQSLRGHRVLTDKQLEKVKAGGEDALDDILSNRTPTTNEEAERVFEESPEAPQNVMERVHMAAQGMTKDPGNVIKAIFTEERMRKIENDAVILERELYLNNLNDKNLHVDHVIPLGLGGDNSDGNLQVMTVDEKTKKDKLEKQLIYKLQTGQIDRVSAQAQIRAFNMENPVGVPYDRMSKTKQKALEDKVVEITDVEDENGYPTMPKLTGNKELDKKLMSKFRGEITKKKNEIVKAYEAGEITAEEAEAELMKLNSIESSSKAKSGKGRAKKLKIKFVKPKYVQGKVRASSGSVLNQASAGIANFTQPQISTPDMQVPNIRVGTPSKPVFNVKFNL